MVEGFGERVRPWWAGAAEIGLAFGALAVVAATHYGYRWLASVTDAKWWLYCWRSAEVLVMCGIALSDFRTWSKPARAVVLLAIGMTALEELQIGFCGALRWGSDGAWQVNTPLCVSALSSSLYALGLTIAVALLLFTRIRPDE